MRRRLIQLLVNVALTLVYALAFFHAAKLAGTIGARPWWVKLFTSPFAGAFVWFTLLRIITIVLIGAPIGFLVGLLNRRQAALVAVSIGIVAFVMAEFPLVVRLMNTDAFIKVTLLVDIIAMATVAAAVASFTAKRLPSNNRWRGP